MQLRYLDCWRPVRDAKKTTVCLSPARMGRATMTHASATTTLAGVISGISEESKTQRWGIGDEGSSWRLRAQQRTRETYPWLQFLALIFSFRFDFIRSTSHRESPRNTEEEKFSVPCYESGSPRRECAHWGIVLSL